MYTAHQEWVIISMQKKKWSFLPGRETRASGGNLLEEIRTFCCCCFSVAHLCPTLRSHGLQHASFPCPPVSPRICWNLCPLSQWCYVNISSSAAPFSCPQSFPASGSFPVSRLFASGGQKLELQFQHQSFQWIFRVEFSARKSVIVWEGRERIPGVSRGAASWDLHLSWEGVSSEESWDKGTLVNFTTLIVKKLFFKKDDDNNMMKKKGLFNGS